MNNFLGPEEMNSCTDFKFLQEEWHIPEITRFLHFSISQQTRTKVIHKNLRQ